MTMRALITRPRAEAETLAAELARRDIEPVLEPLIEIVPHEKPLAGLADLQAFLCTSANGVRALAQATAERQTPLFAVGDATAAAARHAGFERVASAGGNVTDLSRLVRDRLRPKHGRLLHASGTDVAGDLAGELAAAGFTVERTVLYEARPITAFTPGTMRLLVGGQIALALFFSPRTAAIFARLAAEPAIVPGLTATSAVSISRATDAALGDLAFRKRAVAGTPAQAALLALVDAFAPQPA